MRGLALWTVWSRVEFLKWGFEVPEQEGDASTAQSWEKHSRHRKPYVPRAWGQNKTCMSAEFSGSHHGWADQGGSE